MKTLLSALDRILSPVLILSHLFLCVILLASVSPPQRIPLFFTILWASVMMLGLRWGIWGILQLARTKTKAEKRSLRILVRSVEITELLLAAVTLTLAIQLREIPSLWLFLPAPLFGLQGALRFDIRYTI